MCVRGCGGRVADTQSSLLSLPPSYQLLVKNFWFKVLFERDPLESSSRQFKPRSSVHGWRLLIIYEPSAFYVIVNHQHVWGCGPGVCMDANCYLDEHGYARVGHDVLSQT